jgi:hypothetical protein
MTGGRRLMAVRSAIGAGTIITSMLGHILNIIDKYYLPMGVLSMSSASCRNSHHVHETESILKSTLPASVAAIIVTQIHLRNATCRWLWLVWTKLIKRMYLRTALISVPHELRTLKVTLALGRNMRDTRRSRIDPPDSLTGHYQSLMNCLSWSRRKTTYTLGF